MKQLARQIRGEFGLTSPRVLKSDLRKIYNAHGLTIDLWPLPGMAGSKLKKLKGAYLVQDQGPCVLVDRYLPTEPQIFTMAHELKHHLVDQDAVGSVCSPSNATEHIEIGAEIFAAELIYPEADFAQKLAEMGVMKGSCTAESIVHLKKATDTTLSYAGLAKRAEFLGFAAEGSLNKVQWKKLEEKLYGEPIYKRVQRYRKAVAILS